MEKEGDANMWPLSGGAGCAKPAEVRTNVRGSVSGMFGGHVSGRKRILGCCAELLGRPEVHTVRVQDGQSLTNAGT